MPVELKITVKGENSFLRTGLDCPVYEKFTFDENDPVLAKYIKEAMSKFTEEIVSVRVRALMVIK